MGKLLKFSIFLAVVLVFFLFLSGSIALPGTGDGDGLFTKKPKIVCDVNLYNAPILDTKISSYQCHTEGTCGPFDNLLNSFQPMALWSDTGDLKLIMGQDVSTKRYTIAEPLLSAGYKSLSISICSTTPSGILRLTDEDGNTLETKEVNI